MEWDKKPYSLVIIHRKIAIACFSLVFVMVFCMVGLTNKQKKIKKTWQNRQKKSTTNGIGTL